MESFLGYLDYLRIFHFALEPKWDLNQECYVSCMAGDSYRRMQVQSQWQADHSRGTWHLSQLAYFLC